ncbi:hypothetical protein [Ensifer sp. Root558]|uniref:hypothetical protein n=1 Tax=Ensifer sp. Root558 TaxID=1736558 RepID=UPI000712FD1F|nr:hypothetical protein [Ensifer sp. Root558]KQZ57377.1 hypothetical protein ASD63_23540 [Ensifer sp. Root558]
MSEETDLEYTKQVLFVLKPELQALDDETIDKVAKGEPVEIPTSEFEVNVDFQDFVAYAQALLPLIAAALAIIKSSYDLWVTKRQEEAANDLYNRLIAENVNVFEGLKEDTVKTAIRTTLYTVMKDRQRE